MENPVKTKTPRQERYLDRLIMAKAHLHGVIADLDYQTIISEPVVGDWTVKDIHGHIVSWNDEFRREIAMILQGKHPGYELVISGADDFAAWNQHWIEEKRDWTWEEIVTDIIRDYYDALQLILSLSPQDFRQRGVTPWKSAALTRPEVPGRADTDSVDTLVTFHWRHANQHIRMIERWKKKWQRD